MFLKDSAMENAIAFLKWNILLSNLLRIHHLFEIIQTSLTVKSSENVVKSGCFEKRLLWRAPIFFQNEGRIYSLSCIFIDTLLNY